MKANLFFSACVFAALVALSQATNYMVSYNAYEASDSSCANAPYGALVAVQTCVGTVCNKITTCTDSACIPGNITTQCLAVDNPTPATRNPNQYPGLEYFFGADCKNENLVFGAYDEDGKYIYVDPQYDTSDDKGKWRATFCNGGKIHNRVCNNH
jgi:hypothetical protein